MALETWLSIAAEIDELVEVRVKNHFLENLSLEHDSQFLLLWPLNDCFRFLGLFSWLFGNLLKGKIVHFAIQNHGCRLLRKSSLGMVGICELNLILVFCNVFYSTGIAIHLRQHTTHIA